MKALTISQPYASLIASGEKWVENRVWHTLYRGPLAIHAGKGMQYLDTSQLRRCPTGAIVAVCRLVACVSLEGVRRGKDCDCGQLRWAKVTPGQLLLHVHSEGPYCWVLRDVVKLPSPVPCRGAQGLWNVPAEIEAACRVVEVAQP